MEKNDRPCCPADALRRIRQVKINGLMTGITMLDECIAYVQDQGCGCEPEIRATLVKRIRIYNYIPKSVECQYADALMEEYRKTGKKT